MTCSITVLNAYKLTNQKEEFSLQKTIAGMIVPYRFAHLALLFAFGLLICKHSTRFERSFGCIVYELIGKKEAFDGTDYVSIQKNICDAPVPNLNDPDYEPLCSKYVLSSIDKLTSYQYDRFDMSFM